MQSSGSEGASALACGHSLATSWVMSPATVALDQQQPIPPAFDYQAKSDIDPGSVDSLWKIYDWQYRCNSGMLPQHFSQPLHFGTAFTYKVPFDVFFLGLYFFASLICQKSPICVLLLTVSHHVQCNALPIAASLMSSLHQ
jgi:hypothetical protein